jgi:hypothetical protein
MVRGCPAAAYHRPPSSTVSAKFVFVARRGGTKRDKEGQGGTGREGQGGRDKEGQGTGREAGARQGSAMRPRQLDDRTSGEGG